MLLRTGDISGGISLAKQVDSQTLYRDCGQLLESIRHNVEAGQMYEKGGNYEKAAMLYIQDMNFDAAGAVLSKVNTPKLFTQYAKVEGSVSAQKHRWCHKAQQLCSRPSFSVQVHRCLLLGCDIV